MEQEKWKDIVGYEGLYQISDLGRVRSRSGNIISLELTQRGYYRVSFYVLGVRRRYRVHRLVAIAFVKNPHNLPQVDHINGDKTDNRAVNLRWVSNIENCRFHNKRQPRKGSVKVKTKDGTIKIYPSMRAAARDIGVSRYGVMAVLNGTQKTTAGGATITSA